MKNILFWVFLFLSVSTLSFGQSPDISMLRFYDNNSAIKADENDWGVHRAIKEIELGSNGKPTLSIGGDVRLQAWSFNNANFGDNGPDQSYLYQRVLLHADLNISNNFRLFSQIGSMHTQGKDFIIPDIDVDKLSMRLLFADIKFKVGTNFLLRVGRQELSYGDSRMMSFREGPNIRLSYDGLKLTLRENNLQGDFFVVRPMVNNKGVFDNKTSDEELVYATYWTYKSKKNLNLDFYYFGLEKDEVFYFDYSNINKESRHTLGFRIGQSNTPLFHNTEVSYQFGKFGNENIQAFQQITQLGYQFKEVKCAPSFLIQEFIHSGDKDQDDGTINTFRTISARPSTGSKFGFASSNAIILMPEVNISPANALTLKARYMWIWRYSTSDIIYNPGNSSIMRNGIAEEGFNEKFLAEGFEFDAAYIANKHLSFDLQAGFFTAGDYATATGAGERLSSFLFNCSYKF